MPTVSQLMRAGIISHPTQALDIARGQQFGGQSTANFSLGGTVGSLLGGAIRGWVDSGTGERPAKDILTGDLDKLSGEPRRRRRRRRLLTCSDKADIAFLHGQLGGGQLGRAAISSLLSRRCG